MATTRKVTAFVGSARKKHTWDAVRLFIDALEALGGVESEVVVLSDHDIRACRGCKTCFDRGEEFCPLKDDRDLLFGKIAASDGVVLATPVYSFQVSGTMKLFLDRLGFLFHRPRFFGKTFTSIVVQGIFGGPKVVKYLDFCGDGLGFDVVEGSCVRSMEPVTEKQRRRTVDTIERHARRFHERLVRPPRLAPSVRHVVAFRMARTSMKLTLDPAHRDFRHYTESGWFESDYFYPAKLGPLKKTVGALADSVAAAMARRR